MTDNIKELKDTIWKNIYHESWEDKSGVQVIDVCAVMKIITKELKKCDKENKE